MSQFRSEDMALVQLFIQSEAAHDTLHALGAINSDEGCIQFKDLNADKSAFQRLFVSDVRRCDDMLRILRLLRDQISREKKLQGEGGENKEVSLHELHDKLIELEREMKEHGNAYVMLKKQDNDLEEHCKVLSKGEKWFSNASSSIGSSTARDDAGVEMADMEGGGQRGASMLGHIAGCVPTENMQDMRLTIFRATRGNMLIRTGDTVTVTDPTKEEQVEKTVFIVFFSGERSRQKIEKICDSYGASKYNLPEDKDECKKLLQTVKEKKEDLQVVLQRTQEFKLSKLRAVKDSVEYWYEYVMREKAIFVTLNMFNYDVTHKCLIAEGWCPTADMDDIRKALREGTSVSRASVQSVLHVVWEKAKSPAAEKPPPETPPTYFRNEPIAKGTQSIVDAYGMARYQEFNPAVFSVSTFPFLFGVMFGDIGHGFMMAMAGFLLVHYEAKLAHLANDEMFGTVYKGRYNILLMGIFATYSGFIYNELFAVPLEVFGSTAWCSGEMADDASCAAIPGTHGPTQLQKWIRTNMNEAYDFKKQQSSGVEVSWEVYPMGSDPGWAHTANKLNFVNSFKMKFAIIAGVIQMVAGVCTKLMNCLYFKDMVTLYWVYIPEMVFINSIFGYLCILILTKWTTNWDATFVLNNEEVVSIPQAYCIYDAKSKAITNLPCWTAPFEYSKDAASKLLGGLLDSTEGWCMKNNVPTAGCAVYNYDGQLVVETNTFGNTTMPDDAYFNAATCKAGAAGCMLYKQSPPSLLDTLIKMFMEIGSVPVNAQTIAGQGGIQVILILMAVVAVPCLLFPKPYILKWEHEKTSTGPSYHEDDDEEEAVHAAPAGGGHGHGHGEFDFGEEMVHQMIHTIEYVLGCISNTASYLRLWALSLAHAQLSEVFWEKTVVEIGLESSSALMLFVTISAWACFTVGVLMGMESLSAFLHALRLHWVEFMNKFYFGDGYKFAPFGFANTDQILGESSD